MPHPMFRPRRLREKPLLRKMVRETDARASTTSCTRSSSSTAGACASRSASMPGQFRLSIDELVRECKDVAGMGIPAVLLFGLPAREGPARVARPTRRTGSCSRRCAP